MQVRCIHVRKERAGNYDDLRATFDKERYRL